MSCSISFTEIDIFVQLVRHAKAPLVNFIYMYVHIHLYNKQGPLVSVQFQPFNVSRWT